MQHDIALLLSLLAIGCVFSYGERINMIPFNQKDSETNCTHGLISDVDTVVFKAEVDVSGDINMRFVYFQRKSISDSQFLFCKGFAINGSVADPNIWEIIRPHVAQFTMKEKANTENSGARIRGVLVTSDFNEIVSEQQIYPEIRESTDIQIRLIINGVETPIHNNICYIQANGADIVILIECESQALPCWIEMSATDLKTPLLRKGVVLHISSLPELNITIKYASCTLQGKFNTINCLVKRDVDLETKAITKEIKGHIVYILCTIIAILIFIIIGISSILLCKRLKFLRECPQHKKVSSVFKPKRENSFICENIIEGNNLESNTSYNSPLINNGGNVIDTPMVIETDEEEVTNSLISNDGNLIRKDEQSNENLKKMEVLTCQDNGLHNFKGPMSIATMECGNEDGEKDKHYITIGDEIGEKGQTGPLKLSNDVSLVEDSCKIMEKDAKKTDECILQKNKLTTPSDDHGNDGILSKATTLKESTIENKDHCEDREEKPSKTNNLSKNINQDNTKSVPGYATGIGRIVEQKTLEEILQMLKIRVKEN